MRKVSYEIEGNQFTSYADAMQFKAIWETALDRSLEMKTILEEVVPDADEERKAQHRAKVIEIVHAGYSVPMKGGVQ